MKTLYCLRSKKNKNKYVKLTNKKIQWVRFEDCDLTEIQDISQTYHLMNGTADIMAIKIEIPK
jgi:hypothetical protein